MPAIIKIYSESDSQRLRYIAGFLLGDILGLDWEIIKEKPSPGTKPLINYSIESIEGAINIKPHPLLFDRGIREQSVLTSSWNDLPVFFQTDTTGEIPFDIFAASFFLISRYEEYLPGPRDEHGRFPASSSVALKNGFLRIPVVDLWVSVLGKIIEGKFPGITIRRNKFRSLVTIDLDQPFAYLGKSLLTGSAVLLRDMMLLNKNLMPRIRTLSGLQKDPFDNFGFIFSNVEKYKKETLFFIPIADRSDYDKNSHWKSKVYRGLITSLSEKYETGLHPSYYASSDKKKLITESDRLNRITGKRVHCTRFHFIRFSLPVSYRFLEEAGFSRDYSMGYPEEPGFRAGSSFPFKFYDLEKESTSNLLIHPFQVMDATLFQYHKMNVSQASRVISELVENTRRAGGVFVSIWHNTTLVTTDEGMQWRRLFQNILEME